MTISSGLVAFFSSLDVLASLLSVSTLFIFMMMAVALLVRRYYVREVTPGINQLKLVIFLLQRTPKVWGVPLVPWLPSLSVAINIFLMGSLGPPAFIRFGICTVAMLVYYILVGVHATYDMAHQQQKLDALKVKNEDEDKEEKA
ncbi:hypothetical protein Gohar_004170 [Gossypium harknessii]|uniref:Cationic amino acid transporter C-terminal domain-containing protein n=1 Tax=Gossypium harknessii TaxID=34285 RepID=A0A7J9H435_9ROSI|nr:hypothetical protein [Gossypium harknessii]